jgi:AcrR family transcriptional regulator
MKVSKEKKLEIRKKLIESAINIVTEKGFRSATMREISSKAGFGTATIYNYFPTKEKILFAYFEDKHSELDDVLDKIPDFENFVLKEKLQVQIESLFDLYLNDREFVQEAYKLMFDSPLRTVSEFASIKESFVKKSKVIFESGIEKEEIPELPFKDFVVHLYWDYSIIMTLYWLKDESEGFSNTSQLIDMSLDVIVEVLRSGVIPKVLDIISFLFRSHLYSSLEIFQKLISGKDEVMGFFKKTSKSNDNDQ